MYCHGPRSRQPPFRELLQGQGQVCLPVKLQGCSRAQAQKRLLRRKLFPCRPNLLRAFLLQAFLCLPGQRRPVLPGLFLCRIRKEPVKVRVQGCSLRPAYQLRAAVQEPFLPDSSQKLPLRYRNPPEACRLCLLSGLPVRPCRTWSLPRKRKNC